MEQAQRRSPSQTMRTRRAYRLSTSADRWSGGSMRMGVDCGCSSSAEARSDMVACQALASTLAVMIHPKGHSAEARVAILHALAEERLPDPVHFRRDTFSNTVLLSPARTSPAFFSWPPCSTAPHRVAKAQSRDAFFACAETLTKSLPTRQHMPFFCCSHCVASRHPGAVSRSRRCPPLDLSPHEHAFRLLLRLLRLLRLPRLLCHRSALVFLHSLVVL